MGAKSRGNWNINYCMKESKCANKGELCKECIRFSNFVEDIEPLTDEDFQEGGYDNG